MTEIIPDGITPVEAYRYWVFRDAQLRSMVCHEVWTPGQPMEASCRHGKIRLSSSSLFPQGHPEGDGCPAKGCTCGIYALKASHPGGYVTHNVIGGKVLLWGKIIPGTTGYRAQYAYPAEFHVPARWLDHPSLLKFGVPIVEAENQMLPAIAYPYAMTPYRTRWISRFALTFAVFAVILNATLLILNHH